jgi:hypothetical protein
MAMPRSGKAPGANFDAMLAGTSVPSRPRGSVINCCSTAQAPVRFGTPFDILGSPALEAAALPISGGR